MPREPDHPVAASIINKSPNNWYARARLDAGRNQGVIVNSPVLASADRGAALAGVISSVTGGSSVVPTRFHLPFGLKKLDKEIKIRFLYAATGFFTHAAGCSRLDEGRPRP